MRGARGSGDAGGGNWDDLAGHKGSERTGEARRGEQAYRGNNDGKREDG